MVKPIKVLSVSVICSILALYGLLEYRHHRTLTTLTGNWKLMPYSSETARKSIVLTLEENGICDFDGIKGIWKLQGSNVIMFEKNKSIGLVLRFDPESNRLIEDSPEGIQFRR